MKADQAVYLFDLFKQSEIDQTGKTCSKSITPFLRIDYLATKFEAFNHLGQGDYRTNHDFEDIIYVIDNRTSIVEEVAVVDARVKTFLSEQITKTLKSPYSEEILSAHLHSLIQEERYPILLSKITHWPYRGFAEDPV